DHFAHQSVGFRLARGPLHAKRGDEAFAPLPNLPTDFVAVALRQLGPGAQPQLRRRHRTASRRSGRLNGVIRSGMTARRPRFRHAGEKLLALDLAGVVHHAPAGRTGSGKNDRKKTPRGMSWWRPPGLCPPAGGTLSISPLKRATRLLFYSDSVGYRLRGPGPCRDAIHLLLK